MIRRWLPFAAVALLVTTLALTRLGASDVCGGSEAIMGVFVQQMVEHHDLLFPLDNCRTPMYKPPLFHWTATALDFVFHQPVVDSFNLRLPSAMYAILGAILTMVFARGVLGTRGAILSGLILASSFQYMSQARVGLVDMTLTFFETLSLFAFFCWSVPGSAEPVAAARKRRLHYLFAAAMGLAVLAKGPVGALLPGAAMIIFLGLQRRWATLRDLLKPAPLVVGAVLASSWYIACLIGRQFAFLSLQIGSENFGRFFGTLGAMPPWYYIQPLFLNSPPWSLLVPVAVMTGVMTAGTPYNNDDRSDARDRRAALCAKFLAIFWLVSVVFFQLSAYKRKAYLLPLWPASAVLLSWWVLDCVVPRRGVIAYHAAVATCLVLWLGYFVCIPAYELRGCGKTLSLTETLKWPVESLIGDSMADLNQASSYREVATEVNRLVTPDQPLFTFGLDGAEEPLVFYLRRCAPSARWLDPTVASYLIVGPDAKEVEKDSAAHFRIVQTLPYGGDKLILLHRTPSSTLPPQ